MNRFALTFILVLVLLTSAQAQSGRVRDQPIAPADSTKSTGEKPADVTDSRSAQELFEEASDYVAKKFAEFEKRKMPYDTRLSEKIRQEQRDLAVRYALVLAARKVEGKDVYYLGMLYNLAHNNDAALETMRRFLIENPNANGEPAQNARGIIVIQAAKKGSLSEAETQLAEYAANQPQAADDRYKLENWVAAGYFNVKDYEHALPHAQQMWAAAKVTAREKSSFARDTTLNEAAVMLSETDLKLKKKDEALMVANDLRRLALTLPSGNLYKLAQRRLLQIDPNIDLFKMLDGSGSATPPEITAIEWLDQSATKLADLRGRVVLLDFWEPWCGPCRATFPRLQKWHENYKNKGLVILGLTTFNGQAEGKQLTRVQELDYLRDFKKKFNLDYGFAISDSANNDRNYGVSSIPTTFLIDRRGVVRFISVGGSDAESSALGRMIKKLIEEPAPANVAAAMAK